LRYGIVLQPEIEKAEKNYIDGLLSNFKMNVTALNNYLECPVRFYYNSLVRVPSATSESAQFGSSMHDALNFYYNKMMEEKKYPGEEVLVSRFKWHINFHREVFTPESLKRFTDYGIKTLGRFYNEYFANVTTSDFVRTEVSMEAVIKGIPLRGFIDKLQYWGHDVILTDFKTGSFAKSKARYEFAEPGSEKKPEGGNYWRQAVFYKLLMKNMTGKKKNLLSIDFHFIEPNAKDLFDKESVLVTEEHEQVVTQQIEDTWQKIQAHDFYKGCGKEDCDWCNFVKENKIYVGLHEVEEEKEILDLGEIV